MSTRPSDAADTIRSGSQPDGTTRYRVRADGRLDATWSARVGGMTIENDHDTTTLTGDLRDQSELMGVLNTLHMLRLRLTAVERLDAEKGSS